MPRPARWSILAGKVLELSALALACRFLDGRAAAAAPDARTAPVIPPPPPRMSADPIDFLKETADANVRLYRARDRDGAVYAAFYSDGRLRIADQAYRFAGMVQNGHAYLLQIDGEAWSEVFVRVTPHGTLQLELRDGPFDGRVFACEALAA
ncbi:MAG: hypothetical protein ABR508_00720 [Candidatus Baltobacteraceae bacterium]